MPTNQPTNPTPEQVPVPEKGSVMPKKSAEKSASFERPKPNQIPSAPVEKAIPNLPASAPPVASTPVNNVDIKEIEQVLSQDLEDLYFQMDLTTQERFKQAGEEAARKIQDLLNDAKVNIKKVFLVIMDWLKIIPGINKFFLEQESKIKADEIFKLRK